MDIPHPKSGVRVLEWARELARYLAATRLNAGPGVLLNSTAAGTTITARGGKVDRIFVAGKQWDSEDITGTDSRFVAVPFDGVTAPYFVSEATYDLIAWSTLPDATDDADIRNSALVIDLNRTPGPDLYVQRG